MWTILETIQQKVAATNLLVAGLLTATALASALVAYWRTVEHRSFREFFEFALPHEVITHPSARADVLFWISRRAIMPFVLIPAGVTFVVGVGYATNKLVGWLFGINDPVLQGPPGPITVCVFTLTMLLAYDISYYLYHKAQHTFPFLWELHKVHHSAEVMVGITKDRVHPLDELMNRIWDGIIPGICFGLWTLVALNPVEVTIFGINVYVMRNILMMDFVRHTHFPISFGPLNGIVLCPHWHQLHHSTNPRHYDKNFGLLFSFWDRWFGTLCVPEPNETFKFGLMDKNVGEYQSLFGLWVLPLREMGRHAFGILRGRDRPSGGEITPGSTDGRPPVGPAPERLEIVRSPERMSAVQGAWADLWQHSGGLAFQSPAWIEAWWTTCDRAKRELFIVLAWEGETLRAVLPLATRRRGAVRVLEWAAKDYVDYGDALADPGYDPAVIDRMWNHVAAAGGFDLVLIDRMLPNAKVRRLLDPARPETCGLRPGHRSEQSLRVLGPWTGGEAWFATQSKKTRQNYRRGQKVLSEKGECRFRRVGADEPLGPILDRLAVLKRKWLTGRALTSSLFEEGTGALPALVRVLADAGILHLFVLESDGVIVAISVNFVQAGTMMAFVTTYDPDYERGSPGMILMVDYIRWSFDRGLKTVDFLCGAEAFKSRFASQTVTLDGMTGARTLLGRAAMLVDTVRHRDRTPRAATTEAELAS